MLDLGSSNLMPPLVATMLAMLQFLIAVLVSAHVVLHKRDVRAAIGWLGLVWLVPLAGSILYTLFGINRIRRRATGLRAQRSRFRLETGSAPGERRNSERALSEAQPLPALARLIDQVAGTSLVPGNRITPLARGEIAYTEMLRAIDNATHTLALSTYIFDADAAGLRFVDALAAATARGVAVRVLIDGVGGRYSRPLVMPMLRQRGVNAAEFLPSLLPLSIHYANLRSHRKFLLPMGGSALPVG